MGFFERAFNAILRFPMDSVVGFAIQWVFVLILVGVSYKYVFPWITGNKIATGFGVLAFVVAFAISVFVSSYGQSTLQIFNPGVYVVSLVAFFIAFGVIKYCAYGYELFSNHSKAGELSKNNFLIWILIPVGIFIGLKLIAIINVFTEVVALDGANTYSALVTIETEQDSPVYITHFEFYDTASGNRIPADLTEMNYADEDNNIFHSNILLPKKSNFFTLSWYSFADKKYYSDEFPFPMEKLSKAPDRFRHVSFEKQSEGNLVLALLPFLAPQKLNSLTLLLKENGDIELKQTQNEKVFTFTKVMTEEKTEEEFSEAYKIYIDEIKKASQEDDSQGDE